MEDKKNIVPEKKSSEIDQLEDEEDLLYTHKPEARERECAGTVAYAENPGAEDD